MNDRPLAVFAHPNANGLHGAMAVGGSVAGFFVEVDARQALWAVVAVPGAGAFRPNFGAAGFAGEIFITRVMSVILQMGVLLSNLIKPKRHARPAFFVGSALKAELSVKSILINSRH